MLHTATSAGRTGAFTGNLVSQETILKGTMYKEYYEVSHENQRRKRRVNFAYSQRSMLPLSLA